MNSIHHLRKRIEAEEALGKSFVRKDDQFLTAFLRAAKYNVDKALDRVTAFSTFWFAHPGLINGLSAEDAKAAFEKGLIRFAAGPAVTNYSDNASGGGQTGSSAAGQLAISQTSDSSSQSKPRYMGYDKEGNAMCLIDMSIFDPSTYDAAIHMRGSVYAILALFDEDKIQLQGVTWVETFRSFSLMAALRLPKIASTDPAAKENLTMAAETFPLRVRHIYITHQPWWLNMFAVVMKPFVKSKLLKRMKLLGNDMSKLHEFIEPDQLPTDFGGTAPEGRLEFWKQLKQKEETTGFIGGFALPLAVHDPTGEKRRAGLPVPGLQEALEAKKARHAAAAAAAAGEGHGS